MFGTLLGGLPRPVDADGRTIDDLDGAVAAAIDAQAAAGLEPLTDGRLRWAGPYGPFGRLGPRGPSVGSIGLDARRPTWPGPLTVEAWQFARDHATGLVKQALPGPYTLGRRHPGDDADAATAAFATALRHEVVALADAGCAFIEIEEADAHLIGPDEVERRRFRDAHQRLTDGLEGVHLSLSIVGGNADAAGIDTILAAPYASLAVDLISGPDNWRLVTATPGDRGIVCGALSAGDPLDDGPELLLWAAAYAAASNGRGRARVGLATAGGLERLAWSDAMARMTRLGEAARLADRPVAKVAGELDPRSLDLRSAALGRYEPGRRPGRRSAKPPD